MPEEIPLEIPIRLKRRGVELKLIMGREGHSPVTPDRTLISTIAQAQRWFEELRLGQAASVTDLAKRHRLDRCTVSCTLPLAFLAPDIVDAILDGRQSLELTATRLKRIGGLPASWSAQRQLLGMA